jgi:hypothetical protein
MDEVKKKICDCIGTLYSKDNILLIYTTTDPLICERTLSSRLAIYLQEAFKD